ncbi:MAG: hypothetical protein JXR95_06690 [Deltaproteobacteria bacterium]|nr:hypothetical protein [Deltaproteobacteria bacterium]
MKKFIFTLVFVVSIFQGCDDNIEKTDNCGNNAIDVGEECDGESFTVSGCDELGFYGGNLSCNSSCKIDTSTCSQSHCGDGELDSEYGEKCDTLNVDGMHCEDFEGYHGGTLKCDDECDFDFAQCEFCGDGIITVTEEECDGDNFGDLTCQDFNYYGGNLTCNDSCSIDFSGCIGMCGDGEIQGEEECDDTVFDLNCSDFGYWGCTLSCEDCQASVTDGFNSMLLGGSDNETGRCISVDSSGNIVMVGSVLSDFEGVEGFGGGDISISRYTSDGQLLWHKVFGGDNWEDSVGVVTDSDNSIYVAFSTLSNIEGCFSQFHETTSYEAGVVKFDSDGNFVWCSTHALSEHDEQARDIAISSDENIFLLYNDTPDTTNIEEYSVRKISKNGTVSMLSSSYPLSDSTMNTVSKIIVDEEENFYIFGHTGGSIDGIHDDPYWRDAFIVKTNNTGSTQWIIQYGNLGTNDYVYDAEFTPSGNILVAGTTGDGTYFGELPIGGGDIYLMEISSTDGSKLWSSYYGSDLYDDLPALIVYPDGTVDLYGNGIKIGEISGHGGFDVWRVRLDSSYNVILQEIFGTAESDFMEDAVIAPDGSTFITGSSRGQWDDLFNSGGGDIFITRLNY